MHFDITFGLQVVESSSLVSVLFREVLNHHYIYFFSFTSKINCMGGITSPTRMLKVIFGR